MLKKVWKVVETKTRKIRIAKTKGRGEERRRRNEMRREGAE